ncbi:hypothetical protein EVAR_85788_1 [Eumeta japonica]|uniref:Uncharacterized protein n=1 Tax=Eumeta variegata TaxID=151549 RepID=A0A4C1UQI3_EUMVA|nr:hypothetical protein EVAR_85788_1 [Eumeta japonica]
MTRDSGIFAEKPKVFLKFGEKGPEQFQDMDTVVDDNVTVTEYLIYDGKESEIMTSEIMKALKSMKVGKAAGYDRVSSEMLRDGGGIVASLLYQLINKCWKSHRVPNDWRKAVFVPPYKGKGSRQAAVHERCLRKKRSIVEEKVKYSGLKPPRCPMTAQRTASGRRQQTMAPSGNPTA